MTNPNRPPRRIKIEGRSTIDPNGKGEISIRHLACGHSQIEPSGGKAHLALTAVCRECWPEPAPNKRRNDRILGIEAAPATALAVEVLAHALGGGDP